MVRLTRIYTRGGDKGKTSLGTGKRVAKHDPRVEAYGTVDEANAALGVARLHTQAHLATGADATLGGGLEADAMLMRIQNDLFDLGADLCTPEPEDGKEPEYPPLRVTESQVTRLEAEIDAMNADLAPLDSFILPGGCATSAHLHVARTIIRRAERLIAALMEAEPVNPQALAYANRLSDHLFVMARALNAKASGDVLWVPGGHR